MVLVNTITGERCNTIEICRTKGGPPVLLVGGRKVHPAETLSKFWQIIYANNEERRALAEGGYRIPDCPPKELRFID